MSDKKKKDIPAQEPENENTAPVTEETANTEAAVEETAPETFTVTKEQMEKMEGLAKLVADVNDKYLRLAAEYDNYRKRTAKEKESIYGDAKADTVKPFLEVLDNLERGLSQFEEGDPHRQGMEMICRQFMTVLEKLGVPETIVPYLADASSIYFDVTGSEVSVWCSQSEYSSWKYLSIDYNNRDYYGELMFEFRQNLKTGKNDLTCYGLQHHGVQE
mgnify:CR=1 FL=1